MLFASVMTAYMTALYGIISLSLTRIQPSLLVFLSSSPSSAKNPHKSILDPKLPLLSLSQNKDFLLESSLSSVPTLEEIPLSVGWEEDIKALRNSTITLNGSYPNLQSTKKVPIETVHTNNSQKGLFPKIAEALSQSEKQPVLPIEDEDINETLSHVSDHIIFWLIFGSALFNLFFFKNCANEMISPSEDHSLKKYNESIQILNAKHSSESEEYRSLKEKYGRLELEILGLRKTIFALEQESIISRKAELHQKEPINRKIYKESTWNAIPSHNDTLTTQKKPGRKNLFLGFLTKADEENDSLISAHKECNNANDIDEDVGFGERNRTVASISNRFKFAKIRL